MATTALSRPLFSATDYGAAGDGTTDDRAAIQAAINAANALYTGSGQVVSVFLPGKTFLIRYQSTTSNPTGLSPIYSGLTLKSGVVLQGAPGSRLLGETIPNTTLSGAQNTGSATINVASTASFPSSGTIQFQDVNSIASYSGKTATSFTGCAVDNAHDVADGAAVVLRRSTCIVGTDWPNLTTNFGVRDVFVDGGMSISVEIDAAGIDIGAATDFEVRGCEFKNLLGKSLHVMGESNGVSTRIPQRWRFVENHVHDCVSNVIGYSQSGSKEFVIADNFIHDVRSPFGAEVFISGNQANVYRGTIRGNRILSWGDIHIGGFDMLVQGNTIVPPDATTGSAVQIQNGGKIRFLNNYVDISAGTTNNNYCIKHADGTAVSDVLIDGNYFKRSSLAAAILVAAPANATTDSWRFVDNTFDDTAATSTATLSLNSPINGVVIRGNVWKNGPGTVGGANIASGVGMTFSGNRATGTSTFVFGNTQAAITGNTIDTGSAQTIRMNASGAAITGNRLKGVSGGGSNGTIQLANGASNCSITGNVLELNGSTNYWVYEETSSTANIIAANNLIGTPVGSGVNLAGSSTTKLRSNIGVVDN